MSQCHPLWVLQKPQLSSMLTLRWREIASPWTVLYSLKWSLNTSDIEAAINQFSYLVLHQFTKRWSLI